MSKSSNLPFLASEDEGCHKETTVLKKFQEMITGVPPPTSVTMCKLTVSDILSKYKENEEVFGLKLNQTDASICNFDKNETPLVYYLNSSHISEEIANLFQKVQARFIYSETLSSCNIWFDCSIKANSAKKHSGHRSGLGLSPGSRLSHLARRRQAFSCENLQQLANSERRRHIEIKKQNTLRNRTLERNPTVEYEKPSSCKRALFLSPDDGEKEGLKTHTIKRNLFASSQTDKIDNSKTVGISTHLSQQSFIGESSKKRRRLESREGSGNWPRRALTFTEEDSYKTQERRNAKVMSKLQLRLLHKSKLLWAVSLTLKEKNMSSKDPLFKTCASALFMICRKNLSRILTSKVEGGTSEKMLNFARGQIGGIFKKLGISKNSDSGDQSLDVTDTNNDSNCKINSEQTKENSTSLKNETVSTNRQINFCSDSESSSKDEIGQTSINEKENIDMSGCVDS